MITESWQGHLGGTGIHFGGSDLHGFGSGYVLDQLGGSGFGNVGEAELDFGFRTYLGRDSG